MPDEAILKGWLDNNSQLSSQETDNVISLFSTINRAIQNDPSLGDNFQIGHTYFFIKNTNQMSIQWKYAIRPLLNEYYFGNSQKLGTYDSRWDEFNTSSDV